MSLRGEVLDQQMVDDAENLTWKNFPGDAKYGMLLLLVTYILTFWAIVMYTLPVMATVLKQLFKKHLVEETLAEWSYKRCMIISFSYVSLLINLLMILCECHVISLVKHGFYIKLKISFLFLLLLCCGLVSSLAILADSVGFKHCSFIHKFGLWLSLLSVTFFISTLLLGFVPLIIQIFAYAVDTAALLAIHYTMIYTFTTFIAVFLRFGSKKFQLLLFCSSVPDHTNQELSREWKYEKKSPEYEETCKALVWRVHGEYDKALVQDLAQILMSKLPKKYCEVQNRTGANERCCNGRCARLCGCRCPLFALELSVAELVIILTKELISYIMNPLFVECFESIVLPGYDYNQNIDAVNVQAINEHVQVIIERLEKNPVKTVRIRLPSLETVRLHVQPIMEKFTEQVLTPLCVQFVHQLQLQHTRDQFKEKLSEVQESARAEQKDPELFTNQFFYLLSSFSSTDVFNLVQKEMKKALKTENDLAKRDFDVDRLVETFTSQLMSSGNKDGKKLIELLQQKGLQDQFLSKLKEKVKNISLSSQTVLGLAHTGLALRIIGQMDGEVPGILKRFARQCYSYFIQAYFLLMLLLSLPGLITVYILVMLMFQIMVNRYNLSTDATKAFSAFIPSVVTALLTYLLNQYVWNYDTNPQQPGRPVGLSVDSSTQTLVSFGPSLRSSRRSSRSRSPSSWSSGPSTRSSCQSSCSIDRSTSF